MRGVLTCVILGVCLSGSVVNGDDWPRFPRPDGTGRYVGEDVPQMWSESENLRWKTAGPSGTSTWERNPGDDAVSDGALYLRSGHALYCVSAD
jgi:hypothetical protein